jgi:hypothetical protein
MKILISPTQAEKFDRCKHMEHMPIRVYVRKDHKGAGGFEVAGSIKNPLYDPETAADEAKLEGEGIAKNMKRLKKAGRAAGFVAPAVAFLAPELGVGLGVASAATRAILGDGDVPAVVVEEAPPPKTKRAKKQHAGDMPRYTIAKKNKH